MPMPIFDYLPGTAFVAQDPGTMFPGSIIRTMGGKGGGVTVVQRSQGRPTYDGPMVGIPDKNGDMTYVYGSDDKEVESAMDSLIQGGVTGRR